MQTVYAEHDLTEKMSIFLVCSHGLCFSPYKLHICKSKQEQFLTARKRTITCVKEVVYVATVYLGAGLAILDCKLNLK